MAAIDTYTTQDGRTTYRVRVKRKDYPPQVATFQKLSDAKKWAQITETAILEGRNFPTTEAKRHSVSDMIARYRSDVLPHKRPSTVYNQVYHLQ